MFIGICPFLSSIFDILPSPYQFTTLAALLLHNYFKALRDSAKNLDVIDEKTESFNTKIQYAQPTESVLLLLLLLLQSNTSPRSCAVPKSAGSDIKYVSFLDKAWPLQPMW